MRVLATCAFSFSAAIFAAVLLPWASWYLFAAGTFALLGVVFLLRKNGRYRRRGLLVSFSLCAGLLFFCAYQAVFLTPLLRMQGVEEEFRAVVCDEPQETTYGAKVTVRLPDHRNRKAVYYGGEDLLHVVPGNTLIGEAKWNVVDYASMRAKGVFVLLYERGACTVEKGSTGSARWWPQQMGKAFRHEIALLWSNENVSSFLTAELTGDKSDVIEEDYAALQETGLAHLFAVSGLHCAFLTSLVQLCLPKTRRRLCCLVTIGVLLFYMCMTGMTPSVVRACIMQIFLLVAPLFLRGSDGLTSLSAALMVILLCNPYAAGSVSLQLSFAATAGLVLLAPRLYQRIMERFSALKHRAKGAVSLVAANLSASLGAMVFTVPLVAYYFNILSFVAPLAGVLTIFAAGTGFMTGFVTTLLGLIWHPLGYALSLIPAAFVQYILWVARTLERLPYHAIYFTDDYLRYWLVYVYVVFGACLAARKEKSRKYALAAVLSVLMLAAAFRCSSSIYHGGDLNATVLDVGQGQSVLLCAANRAVLVDCGSSSEDRKAGDIAADEIASAGLTRLDALIVTHYHADHTNGIKLLLSRVPVDTLYLPDLYDEFGVREKLEKLAERYGCEIVWVCAETDISLGSAVLRLFPPDGESEPEEQCIGILASAGDFDVLITGDMPGECELALAQQQAMHDIELLVVGHHGSKHSSFEDFLETIEPEVAIISVGENSYGHPAPETLWRLDNAGAEIYRTDEAGHVTVQGQGEKANG